MKTCKLKINKVGRLVPVLPSGEEIPCILRDSISFECDEHEAKAGLIRVKMEILMKIDDVPFFKKK